ncbi:MAG: hypothetical protein Q9224_001520 [Gallowayella concinna]
MSAGKQDTLAVFVQADTAEIVTVLRADMTCVTEAFSHHQSQDASMLRTSITLATSLLWAAHVVDTTDTDYRRSFQSALGMRLRERSLESTKVILTVTLVIFKARPVTTQVSRMAREGETILALDGIVDQVDPDGPDIEKALWGLVKNNPQ